MKYTGVNHLAMATGDMDATIRFWRDLLGMRLVGGLGEPVNGPIAFDHVAFGMDSSEDVWALKDRLEAAGVECSDMIDHGFIHSVYAFDPNGIPIEFCYEVEGVDIHREPVMADPAPPASAREGSECQPGRWPAVTAPTAPSERRVRAGAGHDLFDNRT